MSVKTPLTTESPVSIFGFRPVGEANSSLDSLTSPSSASAVAGRRSLLSLLLKHSSELQQTSEAECDEDDYDSEYCDEERSSPDVNALSNPLGGLLCSKMTAGVSAFRSSLAHAPAPEVTTRPIDIPTTL